MYMRWRDLEVEQRKSLDYKMSVAREAVVSADLASRHRMAIAFSAGKDSTAVIAIEQNRRFRGFETKESYHRMSLANVDEAMRPDPQLNMFAGAAAAC